MVHLGNWKGLWNFFSSLGNTWYILGIWGGYGGKLGVWKSLAHSLLIKTFDVNQYIITPCVPWFALKASEKKNLIFRFSKKKKLSFRKSRKELEVHQV